MRGQSRLEDNPDGLDHLAHDFNVFREALVAAGVGGASLALYQGRCGGSWRLGSEGAQDCDDDAVSGENPHAKSKKDSGKQDESAGQATQVRSAS